MPDKKVQRSQEEMQKRREKMAAAAEARMAALRLASQQQQLWSGPFLPSLSVQNDKLYQARLTSSQAEMSYTM